MGARATYATALKIASYRQNAPLLTYFIRDTQHHAVQQIEQAR